MADRNGAAIDVDLARIPAEILVDGDRLGGKRLVGFDEIEIVGRPTRFRQSEARSRNRPRAHQCGLHTGSRPRCDARKRRQTAARGFFGGHQHEHGRTVIDAGRVAGRDGAVLVEGRAQLAERVERGAVLGVFVVGHDHVALAALDRDGRDFVFELAGLLGGLGLVLRGHREFVLLVARDLPFLRDILGRVAHVVAVERVPQTVFEHRIDHFGRAHLGAVAQIHRMRRLAHALLPAGNHDVAVAVADRLEAQRHRAQAGAAKLVDAEGRFFNRDAGCNGRLAGRVLALRCREDLPHDRLVDFGGGNACALHSFDDRDLAQIMRRDAGKGAVEAAHRRAGGGGDHNVGHGFLPVFETILARTLPAPFGRGQACQPRGQRRP